MVCWRLFGRYVPLHFRVCWHCCGRQRRVFSWKSNNYTISKESWSYWILLPLFFWVKCTSADRLRCIPFTDTACRSVLGKVVWLRQCLHDRLQTTSQTTTDRMEYSRVYSRHKYRGIYPLLYFGEWPRSKPVKEYVGGIGTDFWDLIYFINIRSNAATACFDVQIMENRVNNPNLKHGACDRW